MSIPDYYDWRAAEAEYNSRPRGYAYHTGEFICQVPEPYWWMINAAIKEYLVNEENMDSESPEFDEIVDNAMSGRLCDIEDYIDLDKIFGEE